MSSSNNCKDSPVEVVRSLIEAIQSGDYATALDLYADDANLKVQFAFPKKVELKGKSDLAKIFESSTPGRMYDSISKKDLWIVETEPGTVVAEWTYVSKVGDETVENDNVIIVGVKDGRIQWSRDYHNHVTRAVADGNLPAILNQIDQIKRI